MNQQTNYTRTRPSGNTAQRPIKNEMKQNLSNQNDEKIRTTNNSNIENNTTTNSGPGPVKIMVNDQEMMIYPVLNENNIYINKINVERILKMGGLRMEIKNLEIWQQAFIHSSYCKKSDYVKYEKYYGRLDEMGNRNIMELQEDTGERLEWLGDGILQCIMAMYLYKRYPDEQEGFLTKIRSKLVKTDTLSKLSLILGMDRYLIISKHLEIMGNGRKNNRILEDIFEAFIGAMMTEFGEEDEAEGFRICQTFIINMMEENIDFTDLIIHNDNYKDQLMRYYQKIYNGIVPVYEQRELKEEIDENGKILRKYVMIVRDMDRKIVGEGISKIKKDAEQKAAKAALDYFNVSEDF